MEPYITTTELILRSYGQKTVPTQFGAVERKLPEERYKFVLITL